MPEPTRESVVFSCDVPVHGADTVRAYRYPHLDRQPAESAADADR
jgi:hypothetical protein